MDKIPASPEFSWTVCSLLVWTFLFVEYKQQLFYRTWTIRAQGLLCDYFQNELIGTTFSLWRSIIAATAIKQSMLLTMALTSGILTPVLNIPPQWMWHIKFLFNGMFHLEPSYTPIRDSDHDISH